MKRIITFFKKPLLLKRMKNKLKLLLYFIYRIKYRNLIIRKNTTDHLVFKSIFIYKEFDLNILNPKFIIDCGAYVGYSTFYFAKKYPQSKIVAIEPEKANFEILKKNTSKFKNVTLLNKAIYYKKTNLNILNTDAEEWAFQMDESGSGHIQSTTIDELLNNFQIDKIDILKIDIEGSEKILFENSDSWIKKIKCIVIELHDHIVPGASDTFFNALKKGNFETYLNEEKVIAINKEI